MRLLGRNAADLPWYGWLVAPVLLPVGLVILLLLAIPAAISIPYFWLFPERHRQLHDFDGSPKQHARLAQWRSAYSRLNLLERIKRASRKRPWRPKRIV